MALCHDPCLDTGPSDDRLPKPSTRIDYDALGLSGTQIGTDPRIEALGHVATPLDSSEVCVKDILKQGLSLIRYVEEPVSLLNEEPHPVRAETGVYEWALDFESRADESQRSADLLHRHTVHSTHGRKHKRLN